MPAHFIAWWNLENLFDIENALGRSDKLKRTLGNELKGWTSPVLNQKLANLASVIRQMNNGLGPDLLGVCEVENRAVLELLVSSLSLPARKYKIIHQDTKDERGIDIAFIYDDKIFTPDKKPNIFSLEIIKRFATRTIMQVNFRTRKGNNQVIMMGNHWPSRSGGQYESEPFRMMAGETLSYWMKRIQEIYGEDVAVMVMGDFNDEPFNRSLTEYALSVNQPQKVTRAKNPYLYNLMYANVANQEGTIAFDGTPLTIDQFMVSKGFLSSDGKFGIGQSSLKIESYPGMVSKNGEPIRYGRPSQKSSYNQKGFSDHLPISVQILEK
jgi:hypothetical protein